MASGLTAPGFDALEALMAKALARGQDLTPVWLDFGEEMILQTQIRAAGGIAPDGSPWPVSARAAGVGGQTLERTGKLIASVTYSYNGKEFELFSDDIRAAVHQEGKTIYPKPGKHALAIPMSEQVANSYQAGVPIQDQYPDSFLMTSEAGNGFIVRREEGSTELEFLFMLVGFVKEKQRSFIGYAPTDLLYFEGRVVGHYGMFGSGGSA